MKKLIILAGVGGFAAGVATGILATKLAHVVAKKVEEELDKINFSSRVQKCDGCDCEDDCEDCFIAACGAMDCGCSPKCAADDEDKAPSEESPVEPAPAADPEPTDTPAANLAPKKRGHKKDPKDVSEVDDPYALL